MPPSTLYVQATLLLLSTIGFYTTWGLLIGNGTKDMMERLRDYGPHILPGTDAPLKKVYLGIEALDYQLTVLSLFFWGLVDGSNPAASLHAFRFGCQILSVWGLLVIEGMRAGNRGRLVSHIVVLGLLVQNFAYAVTVPVFLALYLATSPTTAPTKAKITASSSEVSSVPLSLLVGFCVPSVMLALPAPSLQTFEAKQSWLAVWQGFPIWVSISQQVFKRCIGFSFPTGYSSSDANNLNALRRVYAFLFTIAGVTHVASLTLTGTSMLLPSLFRDEYAGAFNFSKVYVPAAFTTSVKMLDIGAGGLLMLQYDEIVGSSAVLLWAVFTYAKVSSSTQSAAGWLELALMVAMGFILTGPVGCTVALIWARDELVFAKKAA